MYRIEKNITEDYWNKTINLFNDASFYQTWSYGVQRWGKKNLDHFVLYNDDKIVSLAQVVIRKVPLFNNIGIAYINYGPLWQHKLIKNEYADFRYIVKFLKEEYVIKKGLTLRIKPNNQYDDVLFNILKEEGYRLNKLKPKERTIILSLSPSLESLHKGLRKQWRQALNKAEKLNLNIVKGVTDDFFDSAYGIYKEMHNRKNFPEFVDMSQLKLIQKKLPDEFKVIVFLCKLDKEPIAALAWSSLGNTALPVLAATSNKALKLNASYLLFWKMIEEVKKQGLAFLDLGGINPARNPGGYTFKKGIASQNGKDIFFMGQYDFSPNMFNFNFFYLLDLFLFLKFKLKTFNLSPMLKLQRLLTLYYKITNYLVKKS